MIYVKCLLAGIAAMVVAAILCVYILILPKLGL
jgi:hypothetical protein